jgi:hypothetical protein
MPTLQCLLRLSPQPLSFPSLPSSMSLCIARWVFISLRAWIALGPHAFIPYHASNIILNCQCS